MGRLTEEPFRAAAAEYLKRMSRYYSVTVVEPKPENLPRDPSPGEIEKALSAEAKKILAEIPPRAYVAAMCVEGRGMPSEKFAAMLSKAAADGIGEICFIIGSSHGLSDEVKRRADVKLSVSEMTFPHELFRVMLLEQLYRAAEINAGGKYHK